MEEEYYAVDINRNGTHIIFGGKSEIIKICEYPTLNLITQIDDFDDSIIYLRFVDEKTFLAATYDGILSLYVIGDNNALEATRIDIEEDLTKVELINEHLVIGTYNGTLHVFNETLTEERMYTGHNTEIKDFNIREGKLYTLSTNKFIVFDMETQLLEYKRVVNDGTAFSMSLDGILTFISGEYSSYIVKNEILLSKLGFSCETILAVDNVFIAGGDGPNLNVISIKDNFKNFQSKFLLQNVEGISKIVDLGNFVIAFSTYCGKIGVGDYRNLKDFKFLDANVGIIFDFKFFHTHAAVCGNMGVSIIDLKEAMY